MIQLHDYWRSSAAYRVRIGLNLAGLPFTSTPVDLASGEQSLSAHLARNPLGLVPVLAIDGLVLTQSLAILEYLHETRQPGFLPADAPGRARVRALAMAIAIDIHPIGNLRVARHAIAASGGAISMEAWQDHFITQGLDAAERLLDHPDMGRFAHGDLPGLADICLVPQVYNARRWGIDAARWPRITTIDAAMQALPPVAAAHPDRARPS